MAQTPQAPALSEVETLKVSEELMARRLKNRERQRRYRAKKRLEADIRKSYMNLQQQLPLCPLQAQPSSESVEASRTVPDVGFPTRVYSGRKWKKEARLVHLRKQKEEGIKVEAIDKDKETDAEAVDKEKEADAETVVDKEKEADAETVDKEKVADVEAIAEEKEVDSSVDCGKDCNADEMNNVEMIP